MKANTKSRIAAASILAIWACGSVSAGVGDGPRAYQNAPVGTQFFVLNYMKQDSGFNIDGSPLEPAARIDADVLALQYTRVVDVDGNATRMFAILPMGRVSGSLLGTSGVEESQGFGDVQLGMVMGLVGSPALSPQEFAAYDPGFSMGVLAKLSLPVGEYDSSKSINLGTNRFAAQVGLPLSWTFGTSLLPGNVTSFELTPSMWVYGDNTSPTGGASRQSRKPLFNIETHLTHDFSDQFWGSLDAVYSVGGGTTTDGISDNNALESLGIGFTVGVALDNGFGLQFSYGQTPKVNTDGLRDNLFRIKLTKIF